MPSVAVWRTPNGSRRASEWARSRRPATMPSNVMPSTTPKRSSPSSKLLSRKNIGRVFAAPARTVKRVSTRAIESR